MAAAKVRSRLNSEANGPAVEAVPTAVVVIKPPNIQTVEFTIVGTEPLVTNKFSEKARQMMRAAQEGGSQSRSKKVREPKNFQACYEAATHRSKEGWPGIPAAAFRSAMIDACRLVNFKMTIAKLAIFVKAEGYGPDGTGLIQVHGRPDEPLYHEAPVRNDSGVADIRARPMWMPGWRCNLLVRVDLDQFSLADVTNLLRRAGQQVGICEGRPNSKNSHGMGWGTFDVVLDAQSGGE